MLLSPDALECLSFLQAAVAHGTEAGGNGSGRACDPFVAEGSAAELLPPRVAREVGAALDLLLTPHLRGRLRSLELLAPILADALSENGGPR